MHSERKNLRDAGFSVCNRTFFPRSSFRRYIGEAVIKENGWTTGRRRTGSFRKKGNTSWNGEFIASRENGDSGIMPDRHAGLLRYRKTDFHNEVQLVPATECIAGTGVYSCRIWHDDVSTGFVAFRFPETPKTTLQADRPDNLKERRKTGLSESLPEGCGDRPGRQSKVTGCRQRFPHRFHDGRNPAFPS